MPGGLATKSGFQRLGVKAVLEGLSSFDEHHRDVVFELLEQCWIALDVDFFEVEGNPLSDREKNFLRVVTQRTIGFRVDRNFHHEEGSPGDARFVR